MLSNAFVKSTAKTRTYGLVDNTEHTVCRMAISAAVRRRTCPSERILITEEELGIWQLDYGVDE